MKTDIECNSFECQLTYTDGFLASSDKGIIEICKLRFQLVPKFKNAADRTKGNQFARTFPVNNIIIRKIVVFEDENECFVIVFFSLEGYSRIIISIIFLMR